MQRPTPSLSASAPSATTIGVAGAVGANETVEIHGTVGEEWAVGLKGEVLRKEAAEGKEQWAGNRQLEKSGSRGKGGGKGHMGRERSTSLDGCTFTEGERRTKRYAVHTSYHSPCLSGPPDT